MVATLTGRSGAPAAAPADKASKNGSDFATTQNHSMVGDYAAAPVSIPENVKQVSVQVGPTFTFNILDMI